MQSTCTIRFTSQSDKVRAFYELVHSKAQFSGIGKDTFVISEKDCRRLMNKKIGYEKVK